MSRQYEVENIVDSRFDHGKLQFFVKWKGYSKDQNTWEPESNLKNCADLLKDFKAKMKNNESKKFRISSSPKKANNNDSDSGDISETPVKRSPRLKASRIQNAKSSTSASLRTPALVVACHDSESSENDNPIITPKSRSKKRFMVGKTGPTSTFGDYLRRSGHEIDFVNFKFDDRNVRTLKMQVLDETPSKDEIKEGISYIYAELKPKAYVVKLKVYDVLAVVDEKAVQKPELTDFKKFKANFSKCMDSVYQDIANVEAAISLHYKNLKEKDVPDEKTIRADIHFRREQIGEIERNAKKKYDLQKKLLSGRAYSKGLDVLDEHEKAFEDGSDPKICSFDHIRAQVAYHRGFFENF